VTSGTASPDERASMPGNIWDADGWRILALFWAIHAPLVAGFARSLGLPRRLAWGCGLMSMLLGLVRSLAWAVRRNRRPVTLTDAARRAGIRSVRASPAIVESACIQFEFLMDGIENEFRLRTTRTPEHTFTGRR
jgi:hypothetical protein